jgi:hypothetical protein
MSHLTKATALATAVLCRIGRAHADDTLDKGPVLRHAYPGSRTACRWSVLAGPVDYVSRAGSVGWADYSAKPATAKADIVDLIQCMLGRGAVITAGSQRRMPLARRAAEGHIGRKENLHFINMEGSR